MRSKSNTRCASNIAGLAMATLLSASLFLLLLPTGVGAFSSPQRRGLFETERCTSTGSNRLASENNVRGKIPPATVAPKSSVLFSSSSDRNNISSRGSNRRRTRIVMTHIRQFLTNLHRRTIRIKHVAAMILLAVALTLGAANPALAGRSGGRAGGSFGRSCSPANVPPHARQRQHGRLGWWALRRSVDAIVADAPSWLVPAASCHLPAAPAR